MSPQKGQGSQDVGKMPIFDRNLVFIKVFAHFSIKFGTNVADKTLLYILI